MREGPGWKRGGRGKKGGGKDQVQGGDRREAQRGRRMNENVQQLGMECGEEPLESPSEFPETNPPIKEHTWAGSRLLAHI